MSVNWRIDDTSVYVIHNWRRYHHSAVKTRKTKKYKNYKLPNFTPAWIVPELTKLSDFCESIFSNLYCLPCPLIKWRKQSRKSFKSGCHNMNSFQWHFHEKDLLIWSKLHSRLHVPALSRPTLRVCVNKHAPIENFGLILSMPLIHFPKCQLVSIWILMQIRSILKINETHTFYSVFSLRKPATPSSFKFVKDDIQLLYSRKSYIWPLLSFDTRLLRRKSSKFKIGCVRVCVKRRSLVILKLNFFNLSVQKKLFKIEIEKSLKKAKRTGR